MSKGDEVQLEFINQLETHELIRQNELARSRNVTTIDYGTVLNVSLEFFFAV